MLRDIHALWIGQRVPPMAAGCLASFARLGHRVILHTYANLKGVPKPIETSDANLIVPKAQIFRHIGSGQYAIFSDYFRYKLFSRDAGIWVDCDVYCVRPIDIAGDYIFGLETDDVINNAVLRLPGGPILQAFLALFEGKVRRPRWISSADWCKCQVKSVLHRVPWTAASPWGATGPKALSYLAEKHGVAGLAQPRGVFYPVAWQKISALATAAGNVNSYVASNTRTIHLWNEIIRTRAITPEAGSFLDRIESEGNGGKPALEL